MPTESNLVGPLMLPVAVAGGDTPLRDQALDGILDYLAHWLKWGLDDKLAEMGGPNVASVVTDACPTGNRFPWDHGGSFMRAHDTGGVLENPLPGLWAWEESSQWSREFSTLTRDAVERTIKVQYIFPALQAPLGIAARSGVIGAVSRLFWKAAYHGRHSTWAYDGNPAGTQLFRALGLLGFTFVRGRPGRIAATPTAGAAGNGRSRGEGATQRFFPSYEATFSVIEPVGLNAALDADTITTRTFDIRVGEEEMTEADTLLLLQGEADP